MIDLHGNSVYTFTGLGNIRYNSSRSLTGNNDLIDISYADSHYLTTASLSDYLKKTPGSN